MLKTKIIKTAEDYTYKLKTKEEQQQYCYEILEKAEPIILKTEEHYLNDYQHITIGEWNQLRKVISLQINQYIPSTNQIHTAFEKKITWLEFLKNGKKTSN